MAILLRDLLDQVPLEVRDRVKATLDRVRAPLRDAIRAECRLSMKADAEDANASAQVPIELEGGCPEILKAVEFSDELELFLLLTRYRRGLAETASGTASLLALHSEISSLSNGHAWANIDSANITATREWAIEMLHRLSSYDPLGRVLVVNEDILGAYIYRANVSDEHETNAARISLYWCVIGLVSDWLGCSVEELTVVVAAHELAHAYTQLGADIEGRRWPSRDFSRAEIALKEGLAQFYTQRTLTRLSTKFPGALDAFESLLESQSEPYHAHKRWIDRYSAEAVRQAMIEVRRWREGSVDQFEERLYRISEQLKRGNESRF